MKVELTEYVRDMGKEAVFNVTSEYDLAVSRSLYLEDPDEVKKAVHRLMVRMYAKQLGKELGVKQDPFYAGSDNVLEVNT